MRVKFSPSVFNTYLQCSQKYYFAYEDDYVKEHKREFEVPRPYLYAGGKVHLAIAKFFRLEPSQQTRDNLIRLLIREWRGPAGQRGGFTNLDDEREWLRQAKSQLEVFYQHQADISRLAYGSSQEKSEALLEAPLAPDIILWGRVDRIDREADGLHVIDYKTGKEQSDELQLMIYAFLAEATISEPVKQVSYFYLKSGQMQTFEADDGMRRQATGRINHTVKAIREKRFSPKLSRLCQTCEYLSICPAKEQVVSLITQGFQPVHEELF